VTRIRQRPLWDWSNQIRRGRRILSRKTIWDGSNSVVKTTTYASPTHNENSLKSSEITQDDIHPSWSYSRPTAGVTSGDTGGPFFNQKKTVRVVYPTSQSASGTSNDGYFEDKVEYFGPILATTVDSSLAWPVPTLKNLSSMGTTAIARCKPTNAPADLANFLIELRREGLPKLFGATLWEKHALSARSAGEEYLNKEFGWDPLVGDVRDISHGITHAHSVLTQYERDSGRLVRRRYEFPVEKTDSVVLVSSYDPVLYPDHTALYNLGSPRNSLYKRTQTSSRVWFSGAFTYHLPSDYYSRRETESIAAKASVLLGLDLSPEVVWNAMPWTWAIDWFSSIGDVISNVSDWATDGLVLKYGYIMEHHVHKVTYFQVGKGRFKTPGLYCSPVEVCVETKRREVATPFGFGLSWSGLTLRQKAIAAALGLTRR